MKLSTEQIKEFANYLCREEKSAATQEKYLRDVQAFCKYADGDEVTKELGTKKGNIGFLLPAMGKDELFKTVMADGVLPRKTFSMGHAQDKRYYVEARKIRG